jgi:hypothetical protein
VVTAVVFAQFFHVENFTQRRENAKKFFTRLEPLGKRRKAERAGASESIARINTNSIFQSP